MAFGLARTSIFAHGASLFLVTFHMQNYWLSPGAFRCPKSCPLSFDVRRKQPATAVVHRVSSIVTITHLLGCSIQVQSLSSGPLSLGLVPADVERPNSPTTHLPFAMEPFSRDLSGDAATAIDEAITSLARGVRGAKRKILDLRGYRNVAIPFISRLPDETLAEIFILFEHQHREDCFTSRSHDEPICKFD